MQEPAKPRRRRLARKAGLVGLSLVAALALAGCWGQVTNYGGNQYIVAIHQQNTDDMIHACDHNPRGSLAHAKCVLDVVRWTCHADPLPGFPLPDCDQATVHNDVFPGSCLLGPGTPQNCAYSMQKAIAKVRANTAERLVYEHEVQGPSRQWLAW